MNSQGRHFRDQSDTSKPYCDYESKGQKCDFYSSNPELAAMPYPQDVSLGPPIAPETGNTDLAQILALLQQQKSDSDQRFAQIQQQVDALATGVAIRSSSSGSAVTTTSVTTSVALAQGPTTTVAFSQESSRPTHSIQGIIPTAPSTPPQVLTNAAAALSSHLNTGLGHQHNLGYQPLTINQLRSNPAVAVEADRMLQAGIQSVPPLNPTPGLSFTDSTYNNQVSTVDQLFAATMRNKQLKAFEFAATGQFGYRSQLKQDNLNAILFAYGSFKHLEAAKLGLIKMQDVEFLARLRHLKNVFEIACLSSNLSSFSDYSWQVAREYDTRVISDIESGAKTWSTLSNGLETDALYCANQTVELKNKTNNKKSSQGPNDRKDKKDKRENKSKPCTTYNTHRASEGCFWEHNNRGETCVYEHFCSWCKTNRDVKEKHKLFECEFKTE